MLISFKKCKIWKLETRIKHPNESQALQTTIQGQSMTVGPWTTFMDRCMVYQPPFFSQTGFPQYTQEFRKVTWVNYCSNNCFAQNTISNYWKLFFSEKSYFNSGIQDNRTQQLECYVHLIHLCLI